jgi:WD40 repeat protein
LWNIDTGKVIKEWTGHTGIVGSVCWSPDGRRVVSAADDGPDDQTCRVWNVEDGKTMLELGGTGYFVDVVRYSTDGTMIAVGGDGLKVWDAKTGKLLKTLDMDQAVSCMAWTSDGKALIADLTKFDTVTWTKTAVLEGHEGLIQAISLSPNERILVSVSSEQTAQLWNLENNQPIGQLLHHEEGYVRCAVFSADGKVLATGCDDGHIYTWDIFTIVKEADLEDLLSDKVSFSIHFILNHTDN